MVEVNEMDIEVDEDRDQLEYYLGDSCTKEEFHEVFGKLMATTWKVIPYGKTESVEINLLERGWSFGYHKQLGALGTCHRREKTIKISSKLLMANIETTAHNFEDTIRHEIGHAINAELGEPRGHGPQWKHYGPQLGYTVMRSSKDVKTPKEKWTLTCNNCGHSYKRFRLTKSVRNGAACAICCKKHNGGKWTDKFKLTITKNY